MTGTARIRGPFMSSSVREWISVQHSRAIVAVYLLAFPFIFPIEDRRVRLAAQLTHLAIVAALAVAFIKLRAPQ